jgi:hypothetical protein
MKNFCGGMNPWDTGRGANMCATSAMAIASIGIINAGNPVQAYQDGYLLASVNQDGEEQDAAASLTAGAAAAFFPGATLETIIEAIVQQSTFLMIRAIDLAIDSAERAEKWLVFQKRKFHPAYLAAPCITAAAVSR